jgi:hypothetical protein
VTASPTIARQGLGALLLSLRGLQAHVEKNPLDYVRWTKPQVEYLSRTSRRKLFRMGNRGGKSFCSLADVCYRARKRHPFRPDWNARRGPTHQWIVGASWDQLVPLMRLFRSFLGEGELRKQPNFTTAKGWGKDSPCLEWPDGSTVTWKTTMQEERMHAGAELDHILIDEPCSDEHYRELERRVITRAGEISLSLTPINAPGPLDWLRDLCTDKIVDDIHYAMTPELFRYADDGTLRTLPDGTPYDQAWIDQQTKDVLPRWRNIVLNGDWDEIVVDGEFSETFNESHVSTFDLDGSEVLAIGFDHGTKGYTETAVLIAVDERGEYPKVYVVDSYEAPENTTADKDAKAIVAMLARHKVKGRPLVWSDLKYAVGDIPHYGGRGRVNRKSNQELGYEIAKALGLGRHVALSPPIWTAKSGKGSSPRGSILRGFSWMHKALQRSEHFTVHPRNVSLVEAFAKYRGGSLDPHGHILDALRYSLDHWIAKGQTRNVTASTLRF